MKRGGDFEDDNEDESSKYDPVNPMDFNLDGNTERKEDFRFMEHPYIMKGERKFRRDKEEDLVQLKLKVENQDAIVKLLLDHKADLNRVLGS